MNSILAGLVGAGGIAIVAIFYTKYMSGKGNVGKALFDLKQKLGQENINLINKDQKIVVKNIIQSEKLSNNAKIKIKEIQKNASIEIVKILN